MRKVCVVITARTSYTKIKPILKGLSKKNDVELQIVCAASAVLERYGNTDQTIEKDGFFVNERIYSVLEAETLLTAAKSTGLGILEFAGAFDRLQPDVVVVMADRYEVLSASIAATYQNTPLAHVQGGEVSGNIDEKVRHANTKLADLHFPATERARDWILRMGEHPDRVFCTGCPSIDVASEIVRNPKIEFDIYEKYGGVGTFPDISNGYYVVLQHPVTTEYSEARKQVTETLHAVSELQESVLWFWPNQDAGSDNLSKGIRAFRENEHPKNIHFFKNMVPDDFLRLLYSSKGIIGNSSVAIRECSFLGVPAVNIGSRQVNRERGLNVIDVEYDRNRIRHAIENHCGNKVPSSNLYGHGDAGKKIADVLADSPLTFSKTISYINDAL